MSTLRQRHWILEQFCIFSPKYWCLINKMFFFLPGNKAKHTKEQDAIFYCVSRNTESFLSCAILWHSVNTANSRYRNPSIHVSLYEDLKLFCVFSGAKKKSIWWQVNSTKLHNSKDTQHFVYHYQVVVIIYPMTEKVCRFLYCSNPEFMETYKIGLYLYIKEFFPRPQDLTSSIINL